MGWIIVLLKRKEEMAGEAEQFVLWEPCLPRRPESTSTSPCNVLFLYHAKVIVGGIWGDFESLYSTNAV